MTKKTFKKHKYAPVAHKEKECKCAEHKECSCEKGACSCGCEHGACTCGGCCNGGLAKLITMGVAGLALVLSIVGFSCAKKQEAVIENWVKENPETIHTSIINFLEEQEKVRREEERKNPKMAPAEIVAEIVADKTNYSLGNPKGKYVIIEFFDHNCGWCKRTNAAIAEALKKPEAKNIRWIPIDTPIFGEGSETISRYVLAAGKLGKYAEMHEAVGAYKGGALNAETLKKLGAEIGLNADKLAKVADSQEIKDKLVANRKYTRALNINGVPMLIVNGRINPGALFGEKLDEAVAESAK